MDFEENRVKNNQHKYWDMIQNKTSICCSNLKTFFYINPPPPPPSYCTLLHLSTFIPRVVEEYDDIGTVSINFNDQTW